MKIPVKVKATGEIVDVTISAATAGNPLYTTSGGVTYLGDDIEPAELDWQQARINAAIAAMQGMLIGDTAPHDAALSISAVELADALVAELKRSDDVYAKCRRIDAINTSAVCENMTKI